MMAEEKQEIREFAYLYFGIFMGAALGLVGNLVANWAYDLIKSYSWAYLFFILMEAFTVIIILSMAFKIRSLLKSLKKIE
jgi:uncharacterized membrane protein YeaQ/YmgE (transglycosylase-associated protein family)